MPIIDVKETRQKHTIQGHICDRNRRLADNLVCAKTIQLSHRRRPAKVGQVQADVGRE
jgi:hypothetical protein